MPAPSSTPDPVPATVTDIRLESRANGITRWQMALSHTAFCAGDTGTLHAVSRSGTPIAIPVLEVIADSSGDLWHVVEKPLAAGTEVLAEPANPPAET